MGQASFNSIWMKSELGKDFDPPACETGMMLVRQLQTRAKLSPGSSQISGKVRPGRRRRPSTTTSIAEHSEIRRLCVAIQLS